MVPSMTPCEDQKLVADHWSSTFKPILGMCAFTTLYTGSLVRRKRKRYEIKRKKHGRKLIIIIINRTRRNIALRRTWKFVDLDPSLEVRNDGLRFRLQPLSVPPLLLHFWNTSAQHYGLVTFLVGRTPRKTVGPVSDKNSGDKRPTGKAAIVTTSGFRELDWDYSGNRGLSISHLASLSSSRLGCDSRRFHSETT